MRVLAQGTTKAAGLVLTPMLAMTALGCGNTGESAEGTGADRAAAARAPADPSPAGKRPPRCRSAHLKADITLQEDGAALVALTNKSNRTCTVKGYATYGGLGADNTPISVSTRRVPHPGPPVLSTLKPGETAFSGLKWTTCNRADENCEVLFTVIVMPPGDKARIIATVLGTDGKPVKNGLEVGADGFTTGSLQPSTQSVRLP
ncbi:DUF4232 domain-containing protein [Streptomyces sp. NPDC049837]|uniref:DUF4232 domain-containing protein n=1 Tax=Streptomyces sp. NPDC049837 TaxID=3155277 RepID=UPI0034387989